MKVLSVVPKGFLLRHRNFPYPLGLVKDGILHIQEQEPITSHPNGLPRLCRVGWGCAGVEELGRPQWAKTRVGIPIVACKVLNGANTVIGPNTQYMVHSTGGGGPESILELAGC